MRAPIPDHRWAKIEALFSAAVELPAAQRAGYLDTLCDGDSELRDEVLSLLRFGDAEPNEVVNAIHAGAASLVLDSPSDGHMIGAYRIERELGRGGMAVVYLGLRADGEFDKRVAIKLIKRGMDTAAVIERLRRERRILAALDHPNIAHLLDGGSTPDGLPYLVMEYVEGLPVDHYCDLHGLGVAERCEIIAKVCDAVAYAHRKLVVHRDLKPANVMIAPNGSPKLLDFGLAKILDAETDSSVTVNAPTARPLTPDYASPEQIRGEDLTTATDIYSLGVILYELLSRTRPYRVNSPSVEDWKRAVCDSHPPRPSAVAGPLRKRLEGDLDNIVMKAMHKDADRRYASADELAADLRNHLASRPVSARQDSLGYRAIKFVRRRRYPLLAAGVALAGLLFGLGVALTQAREAERARRIAESREHDADRARRAAESEHARAEQERDAEMTERRRAEERLAEIVGMSDRSLSNVYAQLERLPGAVPARREMLRTTLDSLEPLSKDAGANPQLQLALAKAYLGLGDLQYDPNGDAAGALKTYAAGLALISDAPQRAATDPERLIVWLNLQMKTASMLNRRNDRAAGLSTLTSTLRTVSALPPALLQRKDVARTASSVYLWLARNSPPDFVHGREYATGYLKATEELRRRYPTDPDLLYDVSVAEILVGWVLRNLDDPEAAAPYYERALHVREQLVKEHPTDRMYRNTLMLAYEHYASVEGGPLESNLGNIEIARAYYKKAQPLVEAAASDPKDSPAAASYGVFLLRLGGLEVPRDGLNESLAMLQRSAAVLEGLPVDERIYHSADIAAAYNFIGRRHIALGRYSDAMAAFERAKSTSEDYLSKNPGHRDTLAQCFAARRGLVDVLALEGKRAEALAQASSLISDVQSSARATGPFLELALAQAYLALARAHRAFDQPRPAYDAAQEAIRRASPLSTGRKWDPNGRIVQEAQSIIESARDRTNN